MNGTGESTLDRRMDSFEKALLEIKNDQKKGFKRLSKELEGLKVGIHGNEEHDQIGYRQRINQLEDKVDDHEDFKKKILLIASLIGAGATVLMNIGINLLRMIF